MPDMDPKLNRFIDKFGLFMEERGGNRSSGRVLAWLFIADHPQSLDDLVEGLGISKAAASQGAKLWDRTGLIERVNVRGDRKIYYQVTPNLWRSFAEIGMQKFVDLADIADEGRRALGDRNPRGRDRLAEMARMYRRLAERLPDLFREIEEE